LAFITPSILSIPLGTFISSRLNDKFVRNKPRLIIYLIASVLFWSFAFSGLVEIFWHVHKYFFWPRPHLMGFWT
jgi:hypothetical protein